MLIKTNMWGKGRGCTKKGLHPEVPASYNCRTSTIFGTI